MYCNFYFILCVKKINWDQMTVSLYNQRLLDHYHNPRNYKAIDKPDLEVIVTNPLCGDKLCLQVVLNTAQITEIGFKGEGCIISVGTASLFFDTLRNKKVESLVDLSSDDILALIQLPLGLNRLKCALLSLDAVQAITQQYANKYA